MFTIAALGKVVGIVFGLVFFKMLALSEDAYFLLVGCLTTLGGIATFFFAPSYAYILTPVGVGLIALGFRSQRRNARQLQESAERASRAVARSNRLYLPTDYENRS